MSDYEKRLDAAIGKALTAPLSEAGRISDKHLLTLEPGISVMQTDEMAARRLTLVLPAGLHETYSEAQRPALMTLAGFIALARERQAAEPKAAV